MFFNTISGKDINWDINESELPKKLETLNIKTINHLKFLQLIRKEKENF
jgi:hypothetical protein